MPDWINTEPGVMVLRGAEDAIQIRLAPGDGFNLRVYQAESHYFTLPAAKHDGLAKFAELREVGVL